jgi:hypothetical protein
VDLLFLLLAPDQIQIPKKIENEIFQENAFYIQKGFLSKITSKEQLLNSEGTLLQQTTHLKKP